MTAPNMATITASLERSLQNCSLNHSSSGEGSGEDGIGISSTSDDAAPENLVGHPETTLELNSQISLPYHWEQCLDLKTGEIYYINWRNGMKAKEDPRTIAEYSGGGGRSGGGGEDFYYSEDEDHDNEDKDNDSSYDSQGSSAESSPSSLKHQSESYRVVEKDHVLVVAGCKSCLMYFMVPKQVEDCPKCAGQLLHFDRSETANAGSP